MKSIQTSKLVELLNWSNKMIEWQTGIKITLHDIWSMRCEEQREKAIREYICNQKISLSPEEFIDINQGKNRGRV